MVCNHSTFPSWHFSVAGEAKNCCSVSTSDKGLVLSVAMEMWEQYCHKMKADLTQKHESCVLKMLPPENATAHTAKMFWHLNTH